MSFPLQSAVVIGAGVMGAGIAAHLANCGFSVLLLDRLPDELSDADRAGGLTVDSPEWRNRIAISALEAIKRSKRPIFTSQEARERIVPGNTTDHLSKIAGYDWVLESIIEDPEIKKRLYTEIAKYRSPGTLLTTNTSGLPIKTLAAGLPDEMSRCFMGTHFFNPPTYARLVEIIPGPQTDPEMVRQMFTCLSTVLDKNPLVVKDTPNFIANRLGIFTCLNAFHKCYERGFKVEDVDMLCGKAIGRMQTAVFKTADAVGLDTVALVTRNIRENAPHDERRDLFKLPEYMEYMIANGWLGDKTRKGFYTVQRSGDGEPVTMVFDLGTRQYRPLTEPIFPCLEAVKDVKDPRDRLRIMAAAIDEGALLAWDILTADLIYAANRVGEIADTIVDIDGAMKWGYSWRLGPFEAWDALGLRWSVERMIKEGKPVPPKIQAMLDQGRESFYQEAGGELLYYDFRCGDYCPIR